MLRTRTTTLGAKVFELFTLAVLGKRNLVIAITSAPFEIY